MNANAIVYGAMAQGAKIAVKECQDGDGRWGVHMVVEGQLQTSHYGTTPEDAMGALETYLGKLAVLGIQQDLKK